MNKTMIERAAKAVFDLDHPEAEEDQWETAKAWYCARACAAVKAMREPTSPMIGAATGVPIESSVVSETYVLDEEATAIWQAMVDAALGENGE